MKLFNINFVRTLLGLGGGTTMVNLAIKFAGCSWDNPATQIIEATTCAGSSWVPIQYQAIAGVVLLGLSGLLKMFGKNGTVKENLVNPSVPVVATNDNRQGVVTQTQVDARPHDKIGSK